MFTETAFKFLWIAALLGSRVAGQDPEEGLEEGLEEVVEDAPEVVVPEVELEVCGKNKYNPAEYKCYSEELLCPITYGTPNLDCDGTCYDAKMYSCEDGKVAALPEASGPFILQAQSANHVLDGHVINACGAYFATGAGARQCDSCMDITKDFSCASYGNQTVFMPDGEMAVDVAGSQYWYLGGEGVLMYTRGDDEAGVSAAGKDVKAYENGLFRWTEDDWWLACVRLLPGGVRGNEKAWRFYIPTEQNMDIPQCEPVRLVTKSVKDRHLGAYKYG